MKRRRLPETDIANWAFLPSEHKNRVLTAWLEPKKSRGSYDPHRLSMADSLNEQLPLLQERLERTSWSKLEAQVIHRCRGDALLLGMNLPSARATHKFAEAKNIVAFRLDARPLSFAHCDPYDFAIPMVITYAGKPRLVFLDLRRTGNLSVHGRRIVMSAQHVRLRERYPELRNAELEIWRYRNSDSREIEAIIHTDEPLYNYEELAADFQETYEIMNRIRASTVEDIRKKGRDQRGSLFG